MRNLKNGVAGLMALSLAATGVVATIGVVAAQDDETVIGVS